MSLAAVSSDAAAATCQQVNSMITRLCNQHVINHPSDLKLWDLNNSKPAAVILITVIRVNRYPNRDTPRLSTPRQDGSRNGPPIIIIIHTRRRARSAALVIPLPPLLCTAATLF